VTRLAPDRGHIIVIDSRPALVLSPSIYNEKSGLCLCCPITSKVKGYPFEVALPRTAETSGVILADHLRSLDWVARRAKVVGRVEQRIVEQVFQKIEPLLH
jgi:mRNA interferase MazF